jgi:hypothetical protein
MTPEQLARYGALKKRSEPKSAAAAAATPGGVMHWMFGDPRPDYNKEYDSPEYREKVDTFVSDLEDDVMFNKPNSFTEVGNSAFLNIPAKAAAAIESLPAYTDDREFSEEYAARRDAWEMVRNKRIEEKPTQALIEGLGGAVVGGIGIMGRGAQLSNALARNISGPVGAGIQAATTMSRSDSVLANVANAGRNAVLGAGWGAAYAKGYDMDVYKNARSGALMGPVGAALFRGGAGLARRLPKTTAAAAGAGIAALAGGENEDIGLAALGAGAIASRTGRRALGSAFQRLTKGGNLFGGKPKETQEGMRFQDDFDDAVIDRSTPLDKYLGTTPRASDGSPQIWYSAKRPGAERFDVAPGELGPHLTTREGAEGFARTTWGDRGGQKPEIYELFARSENPLRVDDVGDFSDVISVAKAVRAKGVINDKQLSKIEDLVDYGAGSAEKRLVAAADMLKRMIRTQGFDGLEYTYGATGTKTLVPFSPVKDANRNNGAFNLRDDRLRFQDDDPVPGPRGLQPESPFDIGPDGQPRVKPHVVQNAERRQAQNPNPNRRLANDLTPVSPDDIKIGQRTAAEIAQATKGRGAARDVLISSANLAGTARRGYAPKGNAAASAVIKAMGGPKEALGRIGQLRGAWDRMNAALSERRAVIRDLRDAMRRQQQENDRLSDGLRRAEVEADFSAGRLSAAEARNRQNASLANALSTVQEEARLLAKKMNDARRQMAELQRAVKGEAENNAGLRAELERLRAENERLLGDAEAGVGQRGERGPIGDRDAASARVREAQDTADRVTSLEENFRQLENLGGLREKAGQAVEAEMLTPGSISGNRKAASQWAESGPLAQRLNRSGRRAHEAAAPELEAERLFEARRQAATDLHDEAGRLRDAIDPSTPGADQMRARLQRVMDATQRIKEKRYPGAERMTRSDAMRLQDDIDDALQPKAAPADEARIAGLQSSMRKALDNLGLDDVEVEVVGDAMMRVITGGKATRGVYQAGKIIINADRFTGDTLGHEAVHGLRELGLITSKEFDALLAAAKQGMPKTKRSELRSRAAYRDLDDDAFDEEIVARAIGKRLSEAAAGKDLPKNAAGRIAQRIHDLGRQVREAMTDAQIDPDEVVSRIASGAVGQRSRRNIFQPGQYDRMNRRFAGFAAYANPRTAEARSRADAANEFGIRLTKGQQSGNIRDLQVENAYEHGAFGPGAQEVMGDFYSKQQKSVGEAIERVADDLGFGTDTTADPFEVAEMVMEGFAARGDARKGWATKYYDKLGRMTEGVEFVEPGGLVTALRSTLDDILDPSGKAKAVLAMFERAVEQRGGKLSLADFRTMRSKALSASRDVQGGTTEAREVARMTRAMDDWFNNAVESPEALTAPGEMDPKQFEKAIRLLRHANRYYRKYKEAFAIQPGTKGAEKRARLILEKMAERDIGINELVKDLFGLSSIGQSEVSARILTHLERVLNYRASEIKKSGFFSKDYMSRMREQVKPSTLTSADPKIPSEEWQALRMGYFKALTVAETGKPGFGYRKMAQRLDAFLDGPGRKSAKILFEPEELEKLRRFRNVIKSLDKREDLGNPAKTGYTIFRLMFDVGQRLFGAGAGYFFGEQTGIPGAGYAGAMAGFGTGSLGARASQNMMGRSAALSSTRAKPPMSAAQEGFINWAKVRAGLATVQTGVRELSVPASK